MSKPLDNDWVDMIVKYIRKLESENARLKAEVERLTERNKYLEQIDSYLQDGINMANEEHCIQLEAQVERLTKAGDDMAFHYHQLELRVGNYSFSVKAPSIQAWEKAKEVQS